MNCSYLLLGMLGVIESKRMGEQVGGTDNGVNKTDCRTIKIKIIKCKKDRRKEEERNGKKEILKEYK